VHCSKLSFADCKESVTANWHSMQSLVWRMARSGSWVWECIACNGCMQCAYNGIFIGVLLFFDLVFWLRMQSLGKSLQLLQISIHSMQ